ncbi:MAG: hypothetical protein RSF13_09060, partial [Clostridiales bacterium]
MTIPINKAQIVKTTNEWNTQNPILPTDTIGVEITTNGINFYKRGDGVNRWNALYYLGNAQKYATLLDIPTTLPANGGNADTVDGKHASDLTLQSDFLVCTTSTGVFLKDALVVSTSDKNGVYNKPALVSASASIQMPPNCILGVRHVQYVNPQNIGVYIYGKDSQNKANIWSNYYTGSVWTGWESLNGDNIKTGFCRTLDSFGGVSIV